MFAKKIIIGQKGMCTGYAQTNITTKANRDVMCGYFKGVLQTCLNLYLPLVKEKPFNCFLAWPLGGTCDMLPLAIVHFCFGAHHEFQAQP